MTGVSRWELTAFFDAYKQLVDVNKTLIRSPELRRRIYVKDMVLEHRTGKPLYETEESFLLR
jgi:hypothetical protein